MRGKLRADSLRFLTQADGSEPCEVCLTHSIALALWITIYCRGGGDSVTRAKLTQYYYAWKSATWIGQEWRRGFWHFYLQQKKCSGNDNVLLQMFCNILQMRDRDDSWKKKLYQELNWKFSSHIRSCEFRKDSSSLVKWANIGQAYLFQNKWNSCYFYHTSPLPELTLREK